MGRSREFEENVVLEKAMRLFLEQGYEKTSMSELVEHMGIHRRSMYDAFGDKHSLFMKILEVFGEHMQDELNQRVLLAKTAKEAFEQIFYLAIEGMFDTEKRLGCLFVNSAAELAIRDAEVKERIDKAFAQTENLMKELIIKGQNEGEISSEFEAELLAEYLHNALLGIRLLSRNSESKDKLYRIADFSLSKIKK